jgi:pimeloyl-ACP methyl ester carboxylesterase
MVDFMGSGGSIGNRTTLGYTEADQVKAAFDFATEQHHESIWLCGTSMGAVAIMKAIKDHQLETRGLILECPFGSMREAVSARFRNMGLPPFPASDLMTFWGGAVSGFWAHAHVPTEYAKHIKTPVLLLYGELDDRVSRKEVEIIADNLAGPVTFRTYALSGHEEYLHKHEPEWTRDVSAFLDRDKE